jgi:hypothetical protein
VNEALSQLADSLDPARLFRRASEQEPYPWQVDIMRPDRPRVIVNGPRQSGKSESLAAVAVHTALNVEGSTCLLGAVSQRQANLLLRTVRLYLRRLGAPVPSELESQSAIQLRNDSRIVSIPMTSDAATTRGFSHVDLLALDESARIPDDAFEAMLPVVASNPNARVILISTPNGREGFFFECWGSPDWHHVEVHLADVPHLDLATVERHRALMTERMFRQEYQGAFESAGGQAFTEAAIEKMFRRDVPPLFAPGADPLEDVGV